jgi:hypothetical protein
MQKKWDFQLDFLKTFSWLQFSILTEFDHENIKIEIYVKIFIKFHTSFIKNRSKFAKILQKKNSISKEQIVWTHFEGIFIQNIFINLGVKFSQNYKKIIRIIKIWPKRDKIPVNYSKFVSKLAKFKRKKFVGVIRKSYRDSQSQWMSKLKWKIFNQNENFWQNQNLWWKVH